MGNRRIMARSVEREEYFDKQHFNCFYYNNDTGHILIDSTPGTIPRPLEEYQVFRQTAYRPVYSIDESNGHLKVTI